MSLHQTIHHGGRHLLHFYDGWLIAVQVRIFGATYTVAKGARFSEAPAPLKRSLNDALPTALRPLQHRVSSWDFVAAYANAQEGYDLRGPLGYPADELSTLALVLGCAPQDWRAIGKRLEHAIKYTGLTPRQNRTLWVWDWS